MPRLASISQPNGQELHCTQLPALRRDRPAAGAERRRALHRQLAVAAHPLGVERRDAQELLGLGVLGVEVGRPSSTPSARRQCSSTGSGARKQVPELITVVPPTARPTGIGIGGRPSATVSPPSR